MEFAQPPPMSHMPPPNMSIPPPTAANNLIVPPSQNHQQQPGGYNQQKFGGGFNNRPPFRPFLNLQRPLPGPLGNMTLEDFDGKRLRKSVMRKTVDYNSSIIKTLEVSTKKIKSIKPMGMGWGISCICLFVFFQNQSALAAKK